MKLTLSSHRPGLGRRLETAAAAASIENTRVEKYAARQAFECRDTQGQGGRGSDRADIVMWLCLFLFAWVDTWLLVFVIVHMCVNMWVCVYMRVRGRI